MDIRRLLSIVILAIINFLDYPRIVLVTAFSAGWRIIAETPASLAHITRYIADAVRLRFAQTVAFIERALNHPSWSAGHFDPGRQPA